MKSVWSERKDVGGRGRFPVPRMHRGQLAPLVLLLGACACASAPAVRGPAPVAKPEPAPVVVPRTIVTASDARSVPELLAEADRLRAEQRYAEAAAVYERILRLDPNGGFAEQAAFGAADAYDHINDLERALSRY